MLGHTLWQRQFQSDHEVIGTIVKLNGEPFTVIGVLPPDTLYPPRGNVWVPLAADPTQGGSWFLRGIGRIKPGVTIEQAQADLVRIHKSHIPTRNVNEVTSPLVMSMRDRFVGDYRTATRLLLGSVAILLLIACVNVASLMCPGIVADARDCNSKRSRCRARSDHQTTACRKPDSGADRWSARSDSRQLCTQGTAQACAGRVSGVGLFSAGTARSAFLCGNHWRRSDRIRSAACDSGVAGQQP